MKGKGSTFWLWLAFLIKVSAFNLTSDWNWVQLPIPSLCGWEIDADTAAQDVVIMLHGFPDLPSTWQMQVPMLKESSYKTILPCLRGYCNAIIDTNSINLLQLVQDLEVWRKTFAGNAAVHFVGHDWGSIIVYSYCVKYPEHCKTQTLVAVPPVKDMLRTLPYYPAQVLNSWYMIFFQLPYLPEYIITRTNLIQKLWHLWSPDLNPSAQRHIEKVGALFKTQSVVVKNALAYYRRFLVDAILFELLYDHNDDTVQLHRALFSTEKSKLEPPTLLISGLNDGCIRSDFFAINSLRNQKLLLHQLNNTGHFVHMEKSAEFNSILLNFIKSN